MDPRDLSDDDLDQLAQQLAGRLPTGTHGDRVVLSRRQFALAASGVLSAGALTALGVDEASAQAAGQVGTSSSPVDAFAYNLDVANRVTSSLPMNGNDIENAGLVSAEQIANGPIYAGNYDGINVDARLDNAIAEAAPGDEIRLERGDYSEDRSISDGYKFIGTGAPSNDGTVISGNWTLNGSRTTIAFVRIDADMTVEGFLSKILNSGDSGGVTVSVRSDRVQVLGCSRFDVAFESGTSGGIVDGGTSQSVTDNGSNTTGDIA